LSFFEDPISLVAMVDIGTLKNALLAEVEARAGDLSDWTSRIWHFGETAWREYRSAAWYVARLRAEGFDVEEGSAGMPTAFCATWTNDAGSSGDGPLVGGYAEYDGVPGNCQQAAPEKGPRDGLSVHAGGHTDPHSALGIGSLGGVLALKAVMEAQGIAGGIRFLGEPAEKVRGSKPVHAAKGYYDGLAGLVSFHPCYMLPLSNTVRWDTHCGESWLADAMDSPIPVAHIAARAPGANEALVSMMTTSRALQGSMLPFAQGWSISDAILTAGQATADNLPHSIAQIQYLWRTPTVEMAEAVLRVLDANAEAAARMAHCSWRGDWVSKSRPGLANHALAEACYENLALAGPPYYGPEALRLAREVQRNCGLDPMDEPFLDACSSLIDPRAAEDILRRDLPPSQINSTSDDYTDICWHAPVARLYVGRAMLKAPPGFRYPAWAMNALGGMPATIDPTVTCAAKTVGLTLLDLMTDTDLRDRAQGELARRRAENPIPPLCDYPPPIHFRWPEYVQTARGEDWWIPNQVPPGAGSP
jgi:aminobenzoyl-glutamate utilization protein B